MTLLCWLLASLSVYGDVIKRFLPPEAALATLYATAAAILAALAYYIIGSPDRARREADGRWAGFLALTLVYAYLLNFSMITPWLGIVTEYSPPDGHATS